MPLKNQFSQDRKTHGGKGDLYRNNPGAFRKYWTAPIWDKMGRKAGTLPKG